MQSSSKLSEESIAQIAVVISGVVAIVSTIANSVEGQTIAAQEIADNITREISAIAEASGTISSSSSDVESNASELKQNSDQLLDVVSNFKI